jgi:hypothetical protein
MSLPSAMDSSAGRAAASTGPGGDGSGLAAAGPA